MNFIERFTIAEPKKTIYLNENVDEFIKFPTEKVVQGLQLSTNPMSESKSITKQLNLFRDNFDLVTCNDVKHSIRVILLDCVDENKNIDLSKKDLPSIIYVRRNHHLNVILEKFQLENKWVEDINSFFSNDKATVLKNLLLKILRELQPHSTNDLFLNIIGVTYFDLGRGLDSY